jgi:hypothetical protein
MVLVSGDRAQLSIFHLRMERKSFSKNLYVLNKNRKMGKGKVKISVFQAVEAHMVARG